MITYKELKKEVIYIKSLLLVIDLQKSFINNKTIDIVERVEKLIERNNYDYIAFTKFINDKNSNWYKILDYKGCISKEDQEIVVSTKNHDVFDKKIYSALTDDLKCYMKKNNISTLYLCGIDTDACVLKTALDLFENGYNVKVLEKYCMSCAGKQNHKKAIEILKRLIGKDNVIEKKNV